MILLFSDIKLIQGFRIDTLFCRPIECVKWSLRVSILCSAPVDLYNCTKHLTMLHVLNIVTVKVFFQIYKTSMTFVCDHQ